MSLFSVIKATLKSFVLALNNYEVSYGNIKINLMFFMADFSLGAFVGFLIGRYDIFLGCILSLIVGLTNQIIGFENIKAKYKMTGQPSSGYFVNVLITALGGCGGVILSRSVSGYSPIMFVGSLIVSIGSMGLLMIELETV